MLVFPDSKAALMTTTYDARGNRYAVATPAQVVEAGVALPSTAAHAASASSQWARAAIALFCAGDEQASAGIKKHSTDGLLIGPFQNSAPFDLLIINTDGSLAERSGNGLTIFAQSLMDAGLVASGAQFTVHVHHHATDIPSPTPTTLTSASHTGLRGVWLDMGAPAFGPQAVGAALPVDDADSSGANRVPVLEAIRADWTQSCFVRLGNPHCVTLVSDPGALPAMDWLGSTAFRALAAIAFSASAPASLSRGLGNPCPSGVNLQWAVATGERKILARVFERGEGPTLSSGTSACAVASALWKHAQVSAGDVDVEMPGGTAPVRLTVKDGELVQVHLFGVATKRVD